MLVLLSQNAQSDENVILSRWTIKRLDWQSIITAVLRQLQWLPVMWRINYKIVVLVFRALHGLAPAYVSTLITPYEPRRALRSTGSERPVVCASP